MRQAAAREIWRVLRPRGHLLWYDFRFLNPRNQEVRPVGRREVSKLFPDAVVRLRSMSLLPPLARPLAPVSILACDVAAAFPFLRNHYAAGLAKPGNLQSTAWFVLSRIIARDKKSSVDGPIVRPRRPTNWPA
jgi:hypothetical protein